MCVMEIFEENPNKFFKISRKSPFAKKLKFSISEKLLQFLGNYTDDVLAEYITVLVCNGKSQNQARDDLEAFLGEKSAEFVSWLWDTLLIFDNHLNSTTGLLNPMDVTSTGPHRGGTDRDSRSNRIKDLQKNSSGDAYISRTEKTVTQRDACETEDFHDDSLTNEAFRMKGSSVVPSGRESNIRHMDESKVVNSGCKGSPNHLSYTPIAEDHSTRQICAANVSVGNPLRRSVWDRLGKPCENSLVSTQTVDTHSGGSVKEDLRVVDQHMVFRPPPNEELSETIKKEVKQRGEGPIGKSTTQHWIKEHGVKFHAANNIGRKRHFGEVSTGLSSGSVCSAGESIMDSQCKRSLLDMRPSILTSEASEASKPALVSQVKNVKQRLHQIELEMSRLRSKQLEMKKDRQQTLLLNSGAVKHSQEDVESRTVFVTNVHIAATKEALSSYFSKCGVVLNVVILTEKLMAQPKGSAYITFARKESVDKALALSGTSFLSRMLKVSRKTDEASVASSPSQLTGKPSQSQFSQMNRKLVIDKPNYSRFRLQWRRETVSEPSRPPASMTNEKGVAASSSFAPM